MAKISTWRTLLTFSLVLFAAASAAAQTAGWKKLELGGGRYALRYVPFALQATPPPLVVFFHGSGSSPEAWKSLLEPHAENAGALLLMPHAVSPLGFGPGDDAGVLEAALAALHAEIASDPRRRSLAGFSSGGALALYMAQTTSGYWSATLGLGAPYRIVLERGDPAYPLPTWLLYGDQDPNYTGGAYQAWREQTLRLGLPLQTMVLPGVGHGGYSAATLEAAIETLVAVQRPAPPQPPGPCVPSDTTLCLHDGRFAVQVEWEDPQGQRGPGKVTPARTRDSGLFYFFSEDNWELQVKVLNGCALNQRYWVFTAGSTNVGYTLTIEDLAADETVTYRNPVGRVAVSETDTAALATCDVVERSGVSISM
jgi:hypothetical protein